MNRFITKIRTLRIRFILATLWSVISFIGGITVLIFGADSYKVVGFVAVICGSFLLLMFWISVNPNEAKLVTRRIFMTSLILTAFGLTFWVLAVPAPWIILAKIATAVGVSMAISSGIGWCAGSIIADTDHNK